MNLPHYDLKPYHFGFSLGFNKMDFAIKPIEDYRLIESGEFDTLKSVITRSENGFNIGIVSNLRLHPQWDLRFVPTLTFGDRSLIYDGVKNNEPYRRTQKVESTFIDFPLHFKYKSVRMNNTRVYVIGGAKYSIDLASTEDKKEGEEEVIVKLYKNDYFYEVGVGIDYYFYYFKFSTEIKASFGVRDMLKRENTVFTNSIDKLNSRIIMVSFLFE